MSTPPEIVGSLRLGKLSDRATDYSVLNDEEEFEDEPEIKPDVPSVDETLMLPPAYIDADVANNHFAEWDSLPDKYLVSNGKTCFTFFKAYVGAGVLFLPKGFQNAGLAASLLTFLLVTFLTVDCMKKCVSAKEQLAEDFKNGQSHGVANTRKHITYGMLARVSIGKCGRILVDTSIALSQLGFAGSYLIFCAKNVAELIQDLSHCDMDLSKTYILLLFVPLLVPLSWIRQLSRFAWAVLVADGLIVLGLSIILVRNFQRLAEHGVAPGITQFQPKTYWMFLGTALYALEGTTFVLPIQLSMRDKSSFSKVATWSTVLVGSLYMVFGAVGFVAYGNEIQTVITLNLKADRPRDPIGILVQIGYVIAIFFSYPFVLFPAVHIAESIIFKTKSKLVTWLKNGLRTLFVMFTALCAIISATAFDNFVGLVGGIACVPLALVYPPLFHLAICKNRLTWKEKAIDWAILSFGVFGAAAATITSIMAWAEGGDTAPPACVK